VDWGIGRYERTAGELEPVAERALASMQPQPGERVLDLATGTGNAALLAARTGASVVGLDSAPRLVDVARDRARQAELDVEFIVGDIHELPFADDAFDLVVSVFGLIVAADPDRAVRELSRVLRPGGRSLVTVWIPAGPIDALVSNFARALAGVTGPCARPTRTQPPSVSRAPTG
jgi:ubiquinone/menaquinone biosynthesis C-methylase UbiE